jgi:chromosome segregation ATPase
MASELVTRRVLARELVRHAATRPSNIAVPAAVTLAGLVFAWWLLPVAAIVYAALVTMTALDGDRAVAVGREVYAKQRRKLSARAQRELSPSIEQKVEGAREEERRIRVAIADAPVLLADLAAEVERLMLALENLAVDADRVIRYLAEESEHAIRARLERLRSAQTDDAELDQANTQAVAALQDQLDARAHLSRQLSRFDAQMEHIAATLGAIRAQIVRMTVEEEASAQSRVAQQVRNLRHEVGAAADAMQETYRDLL